MKGQCWFILPIFFAYIYILTVSLMNYIYFKILDIIRKNKKYKKLLGTECLVSILIPARNEGKNLPRLLKSLKKISYENIEVIVYDDESEDRTLEIAESFSKEFQFRYKVIKGGRKPDGWIGKNFACYNLYKHSRGDILIFMDADTEIVDGDVINFVLYLLKKYDLDALTVYTRLEAKNIFLKGILRLFFFATFIAIPFWAPIYIRFRPLADLLTVGAGHFFAFRRSFYEKIGGHEAVKNEILEDVRLSGAVKRSGGRLMYLMLPDFVSCYMYETLEEAVKGFSKNASEFFHQNLILMLISLLLGNLFFFFPFILFLKSPLYGISAFILYYIPTMLYSLLMRYEIFLGFLFIPSMLFYSFVFVYSYILFKRGEVEWKGRKILRQ